MLAGQSVDNQHDQRVSQKAQSHGNWGVDEQNADSDQGDPDDLLDNLNFQREIAAAGCLDGLGVNGVHGHEEIGSREYLQKGYAEQPSLGQDQRNQGFCDYDEAD